LLARRSLTVRLGPPGAIAPSPRRQRPGSGPASGRQAAGTDPATGPHAHGSHPASAPCRRRVDSRRIETLRTAWSVSRRPLTSCVFPVMFHALF